MLRVRAGCDRRRRHGRPGHRRRRDLRRADHHRPPEAAHSRGRRRGCDHPPVRGRCTGGAGRSLHPHDPFRNHASGRRPRGRRSRERDAHGLRHRCRRRQRRVGRHALTPLARGLHHQRRLGAGHLLGRLAARRRPQRHPRQHRHGHPNEEAQDDRQLGARQRFVRHRDAWRPHPRQHREREPRVRRAGRERRAVRGRHPAGRALDDPRELLRRHLRRRALRGDRRPEHGRGQRRVRRRRLGRVLPRPGAPHAALVDRLGARHGRSRCPDGR